MRKLASVLLLSLAGMTVPAVAADYVIDTEGAHAFVQFRIKHLGYSWLLGRFNDFDGRFAYDEERPEDARVEVTIRTVSIDSNHAERDRHLRGEDFLDVERHPTARFVSTSFAPDGNGGGALTGDLTLHGVTRPVQIDVDPVGAGADPWGGYRRGFEGRTSIALKDFGIDYDLGPASREVELFFSIEGVRQ